MMINRCRPLAAVVAALLTAGVIVCLDVLGCDDPRTARRLSAMQRPLD